MLQARRKQIIDKITQERMIKVSDLMKEYQVSIETIRRDLEYLEKKGYLKRVYGGAVLYGLYGQEPTYEHREVINLEAKQAIGSKAAELVEDGDTLFMDVGTTVLEVAKCLGNKKDLTIITNATMIGHTMVGNDSCRVILLGGELRGGELSVSGFLSGSCLDYFHANKAILGVGGVTLEDGVTDYHVEEANVRRKMIEHTDKVIAVADSSKFGVTAMNSCCPAARLDALVTDWSTPAKVILDYRSHGISVLIAPQR